MLFPDKIIQINLPADVAYGILGLLAREQARLSLPGSCKVEEKDVPQLARMFEKTMEELLMHLEAHDYCEHVREAAAYVRKQRVEGM